ncbi:MAG: glycosyltransferase [Methylotenera sp.]|nr:glycosyltransferase [Methylotenera sp.]
MRVAYFINQYPKVSHSFIRREILALERQGIQVLRIALRGWDEMLVDKDDINEQRITKFVLQEGLVSLLAAVMKQFFVSPSRFISALFLAFKMGWRAERPLVYHFIYLAEACKIVPWIKAFGAQHVHAHFGTNSAEVVMLANQLGAPKYSFTVHGPEEFDKPQALHLAEKIKQSAFVVAISSFGKSQLYRWLEHNQWAKVKVVHCGLESSFYKVTENIIPNKKRLVCVGRLCEQKGQLLLLEAVNQLVQKGIDFELVLAGDGELRSEIEGLIKAYGLTEQVHITGWISSDQVKNEILVSGALVLPSFAEGLPVVIMESMALKRPVLTTYIAGIPELVTNGENGWLFPAGSVESLMQAIETFLVTPEQTLMQMGEAGYARVIERHSIDSEATKLALLFSESI